MKTRSDILGDEKGQSIIMVAVMLVVILALTAMVVDVGYLYLHRRNLQNTADAAALAAAWELPDENEIQTVAETYAGFHNVSSGITATKLNDMDVKVEVTSEYPRLFGRIFGTDNYFIKAEATARKRAGWKLGAGGVQPFSPLPANYTDSDDELCGDLFVNPLLHDPGVNPYPYTLKDDVNNDVADKSPDEIFAYLQGRTLDDLDRESHGYEDGKVFHYHGYGDDFYDIYGTFAVENKEIRRLEEFKAFVKVRTGSTPGAYIGVIAGSKGTDPEAKSVHGFIDLTGGKGSAGASLIAGWIYGLEDPGEGGSIKPGICSGQAYSHRDYSQVYGKDKKLRGERPYQHFWRDGAG